MASIVQRMELPDDLLELVDRAVEGGCYGNRAEIMRAALKAFRPQLEAEMQGNGKRHAKASA